MLCAEIFFNCFLYIYILQFFFFFNLIINYLFTFYSNFFLFLFYFILEKKCTVQLTVFADGVPKVKPLLIFKGTGLRIPDKEKQQYDSRVVVQFQENAWCDEKIMLFWVMHMWNPGNIFTLTMIEVYKCLHSLNPEFMWSMFLKKTCPYNMRSGNLLTLPEAKSSIGLNSINNIQRSFGLE